ncbi:MAG: hypothetical protein WA728_37115 [Xanthobacteraceae bacterium]
MTQIEVREPPVVFCCNINALSRSTAMMDAVMLAIAFGFFAVSIAYVYACDRL